MPAPIRRVGIVPRLSHPLALQTARELRDWLASRSIEVGVEVDLDGDNRATPERQARLREESELVVVLGGDGTLIHASSLLAGREVPIFGVNMGSLGFMTEHPVSELYEHLERALEGDYEVSERLKLETVLHREGEEPLLLGQVLNDVVISKGALARIADLDLTIGGDFVTVYKADGVIVATPTGSTAYSLSAGGPVLYPSLDAVEISPICPHTLTQRPIVVPPNRVIQLTLTSDNGEVYLTLDGQSGLPMQRGDTVAIRRAQDRVVLVRNPSLDYFSILRAKLRWGAR